MYRANHLKKHLLFLPGFLLFVLVFYITRRQQCSNTSFDVFASPSSASIEDIFRYLQWKNHSSCLLTQDFGGVLLVGSTNHAALDGQKAVCLDAGVRPMRNNCIVYSFGIDNEWSFDDDIARYGCRVFSFDPTMNRSHFNRSEHVHFFDMGLLGVDYDTKKGRRYRTLNTIYNSLKRWHGDVTIDYLKADIEEVEWLVIPQLIRSGMLGVIKQIAFEIHMFELDSLELYRKRYAALRSLEEHGMVRFDSKGNVFSRASVKLLRGRTLPTAYEIAWYNSKFYQNLPL